MIKLAVMKKIILIMLLIATAAICKAMSQDSIRLKVKVIAIDSRFENIIGQKSGYALLLENISDERGSFDTLFACSKRFVASYHTFTLELLENKNYEVVIVRKYRKLTEREIKIYTLNLQYIPECKDMPLFYFHPSVTYEVISYKKLNR